MKKTNNISVSILVADYDVNRMKHIVEVLQKNALINVIGMSDTGTDIINKCTNIKVDAVLTEYSMPDFSAIEISEEVKKFSPDTNIFAISDIGDDKFTFRLKKAGIIELFSRKDFNCKDVGEKIYQYIYNKNLKKISSANIKRTPLTKKVFATTYEVAATNAKNEYIKRDIPQSIITIFNSKGGVGKSSVAANLATAIKLSPYMSKQKVALVDFDCAGANLATVMHIPDEDVSNRNLAFWDKDLSRLSMEDIDDLMIKGPNDIRVLPSPIDINLSEKVNYELCQNVLTTLKKFFPIIIIDGSPVLSFSMDVALSNATHILLTANAEGQSVKQLARTINLLSPDPKQPDKPDMTNILCKMFLVLNHAQGISKWDLTSNEVASIVGRPLIAELPFSDDVRQALHEDLNLQAFEINPDSEYSNAMKNLADILVGAYPDTMIDTSKKRKKSIFSFFKRS